MTNSPTPATSSTYANAGSGTGIPAPDQPSTYKGRLVTSVLSAESDETQRLCLWCNEPLPADAHHLAKTHEGNCRRQKSLRAGRDHMAALRAKDPAAANAKGLAWYYANKDRHYINQRRWGLVTCGKCGESRFRNMAYAKRENFVCGRCQAAEARIAINCEFCGVELSVPPSIAARSTKTRCSDCRGILRRTSKQLDVTGEWVRQLVNGRMGTGLYTTKREALSAVVESWVTR